MADQFSGWLTVTVFLPLAGAAVIALLISDDRWVKRFAGTVAMAELVLSAVVFARYDTDGEKRFQLVDRVSGWIPDSALDVSYFLAVDGISAPLVLLTGLLGMAAVYASWGRTASRPRVLFLAAGPTDLRDGRLHGSGLHSVLLAVGARVGPDVLPDLDLGAAAEKSTRP